MKKIIAFLFVAIGLPMFAQTPQIPQQTFTASTSGTVTQNGGATFFIPAWSSTTTVLTITTGITLTTAEEFDYTCVQ